MELEDAKQRNPDAEPGWEQTSLAPFVELFEQHVKGLLKETKAAAGPVKHEMGTSSVSAQRGDSMPTFHTCRRLYGVLGVARACFLVV